MKSEKQTIKAVSHMRVCGNHIMVFPNQVYHLLCLILLIVCSFHISANTAYVNAQIPLQNQFKNVDTDLRAKIAQKLFIDLRYYCAPKVVGYCQQALLELPDELASMLAKSKVGGVILFSENLSSAEQIVMLTHQLQTALKPVQRNISKPAQLQTDLAAQRQSEVLESLAANDEETKESKRLYIPLYIGIDQEGGRVSRLPQSEFLGFAGNMAIGATAKAHKNDFSVATSLAIAKYLNLLGINVNFAPVLDVNSNPNNPIINVRSYGQYPDLVSDLGGAAIKTMQQQNISVAAKHFPGHGDTFIDSHVGLPRVNHSREMINSIDLLPFRNVIGSASTHPDMIMTAHIQYPELDDTRFVGDKAIPTSESNNYIDVRAEPPVLPATLSRKILTGILREELAYDGLIITDALNMQSITQYLTPIEAVIQSFSAGADITLMPYHISSPEDAIGFLDWLNELTIFIAQDNELKALVNVSYNRIIAHKAKRNIAKRTLLPLADKLAMLDDTAYKTSDNKLALSLSTASFTQIKSLTTAILSSQRLLVFMPDKLRCQAFEQYWIQQKASRAITCLSILSDAVPENIDRLANIDALVVGDAFPPLAFYESSKFEGIDASERIDNSTQQSKLYSLVKQAKTEGIPRVLVKLRSPYISVDDAELFSGIFASYDYQVVPVNALSNIELLDNVVSADHAGIKDKKSPAETDNLFSPTFLSLINVLTGKQKAQGTLPVTLLPEVVTLLSGPKSGIKDEAQPQVKKEIVSETTSDNN
ncbi:MAG: beta-N-acetylhexosaminidase [Alphaproteobacteria bacterium]|jgi:beta-N-acetylhexosaminidase